MSFLQDLRHAWRVLAKRPSFLAVTVAVLAVALGANSAVFGVIDAVLLRPLPFPEPDRLVDLSLAIPPADGSPARRAFLDGATLAAVDERAKSLRGLAVFQPRETVIGGGGVAERVVAAGAAADLFEVLGVRPREGRGFRREEEGAGGEPVVVLADALRRRRFGTGVAVGARLLVGGEPHTIVGVMPPGFAFPDPDTMLWLPMAAASAATDGVVQTQYLPAVGRLAPGVSAAAAAAELDALVARMGAEGGGAAPAAAGRVEVMPLSERRSAEARPALLALWAAVGIVLVTACANFAGLLVAHLTARRRELAIRGAIGGGRRRLVRQLLTENLLLALLGGAAGLLLAALFFRTLPRWAPADVPGLDGVALDPRVFAFAAALAVVTACLAGVVPALRSARGDLVEPLQRGAGGSAREQRSRAVLVVGEVALSLVLLVAAGLLIGGFLELVRVDLGFEPDRALVVAVDPGAARVAAASRRTALYDALLDRFAADGRAEAVGAVAYPPMSAGFAKTGIDVEGQPPGRRLAVPQWTSPGYAEAVGLRVVAGRWIAADEHRDAAPVAVVSRGFAQRFLSGLDPLRQRLQVGSATLQVVGVVDDIRLLGFGSEPQPEVYASYKLAEEAVGAPPARLAIVLRGQLAPGEAAAILRHRLGEIEPGVAVESVERLEDRLGASAAQPRFYATLATAFAAVAVLLAAAGLYGVLSYSVVAQRRAFAVRRALGAEPRDIVRLVLARAATLVGIGVGAGLLASWWASRWLAAQIAGLPTNGLGDYAAAVVIVCVAAAVACYLPARRAARFDPAAVLQAE
jgi:putative ABC transport system permease protein